MQWPSRLKWTEIKAGRMSHLALRSTELHQYYHQTTKWTGTIAILGWFATEYNGTHMAPCGTWRRHAWEPYEKQKPSPSDDSAAVSTVGIVREQGVLLIYPWIWCARASGIQKKWVNPAPEVKFDELFVTETWRQRYARDNAHDGAFSIQAN